MPAPKVRSNIDFKCKAAGATKLICVEENATGQLAAIASEYGITADEAILRYDGRPFTYESLLGKVREVIP